MDMSLVDFPRRLTPLLVYFWLFLFASAGLASEVRAVETRIDFNRDVRPLLMQHCTRCHGGVKQAGGVSYIYRSQVLGEGDSGEPIVVPGDPDASELIRRLTTDDESERMPPPEEVPEPLRDDEKQTLIEWVRQGAPWEEHWAFSTPQSSAVSAVSQPAWCRSPLDRFVLAKLDAEGLQPAPEADRAQWLRRVSLDLTGLPPTPDEIDAFLSDHADDAHERIVDRLLESRAYGERWASLWLDLVRYADSMGYERDPGRTIWPYRDWVIKAFNADMPLDDFTIKQLAGDLLPNPTLDDLIATAMHRNSQTNTEGGSDDEEFRIATLLDRVNTTWTVWQGFTFGCVQCHNHPYEPFRQREYYAFAAFFNSAADCDLRDEFPTLRVPAEPHANDLIFEKMREREQLSRTIMTPFQRRAAEESWSPVRYESVQSNKDRANLKVRAVDGIEEVFAAGTVGQQSVYTIDVAPRDDQQQATTVVTALRMDVPMLDGDDAANPSPAFVITDVTLSRLNAEGDASDVPIGFVAADRYDSMFWPPDRWGAFPNQFHDRWAVIVLAEPLRLASGQRLRVKIDQQQGRDGAAPPVLRRFRLVFSSAADWQDLLHASRHAQALQQRESLGREIDQVDGVDIPIMREREGFPRAAAVFRRGNWLDKTDRVTPDVPGLLPNLPDDAPRDRLGLARWLASPDNPLTARVFVNRVWAALFGVGIVETQEDFASSGTPPSHPALLDDLAVRFRSEHAWRLKSLLRELVLSAVYRQDAAASDELAARDPRNRLLARGPRNRLTAEMVRDQALQAGGILSRKMYGPPVMPAQPEGVWQTVYSNDKWVVSAGEDRHRRAVYTYWRRSSPYPSLMTFDASARLVCSARRVETNTPLQALVTWNDPVYVEAAQALARRMQQEGGAEVANKIALGLSLATSRPADAADVATLTGLYSEALEEYKRVPDEARRLGGAPADAALVLVANTILNLDAALTK